MLVYYRSRPGTVVRHSLLSRQRSAGPFQRRRYPLFFQVTWASAHLPSVRCRCEAPQPYSRTGANRVPRLAQPDHRNSQQLLAHADLSILEGSLTFREFERQPLTTTTMNYVGPLADLHRVDEIVSMVDQIMMNLLLSEGLGRRPHRPRADNSYALGQENQSVALRSPRRLQNSPALSCFAYPDIPRRGPLHQPRSSVRL